MQGQVLQSHRGRNWGHSEFLRGRPSGTLRILFLPPFRLRDQEKENVPGFFPIYGIMSFTRM